MEELNIQNFKTYVQYLPTVHDAAVHADRAPVTTWSTCAASRPAATARRSTSQPSVGTYLDEQPITTIRGNLDVHLYDIARVEALAGPQGTLYGASSQAGTIRIITNKPDPSGFAAGYSLEGNLRRQRRGRLRRGGLRQLPDGRQRGAPARGLGASTKRAGSTMWRRPASTPARWAIRLMTITVDNAEFVEDNYNTFDTRRPRGAADQPRRELDGHADADVPEVGAGRLLGRRRQRLHSGGRRQEQGRAFPGRVLRRRVVPGGTHDRRVDQQLRRRVFRQLPEPRGRRINRLFGLFVLVRRPVHLRVSLPTCSSTTTATTSTGRTAYTADDYYTKTSHEIRITTPHDKRVRGLLGFFYQKQYHDFHEEFGIVEGLADIRR